jgi:hypothetical protein
MSFPGTYNIRYYYGDTLEFRVFPKSSTGEFFDLSTFSGARFTIARNRNTPREEHVECFAEIDPGNTNILCTIRPEDSDFLNPDLGYVYDVEISKPGNPYDIVYTLLTGSVTITRDVTKPALPPAPIQIPNNPTNLQLTGTTNSTLTISWTPPTNGDLPDIYKLAFIPFTSNLQAIESAIEGSNLSVPDSQTTYTFPGLDSSTDYVVIVRSANSAGDAELSSILYNTTAFRTDIPDPTEPEAPSILSVNEIDEALEILFTQGSDGGSTIINYKYSLDGLNYTEFDPIQLDSPLIISGLTNGITYSVSIIATNSVGDSAASNNITATPVGPPTPDFIITNDGSGAYLIDGVSNDTITLVRGQTYLFEINAAGHPFWIQTVPAPYSAGNVYNEGITNNGTDSGIIEWTVDQSAPSTLYYVCQFHSAMSGTILIIDDSPNGYEES